MKAFEITKPNKPTNSTVFKEETGCYLYIEHDKWYIAGCETQEEADALIAAHNFIPPAEPTIADKLASVGLSLDELKAAILGGN